MHLRQLHHFLQVAELGSFSRAAVVLGVDQPTLSRHVKSLEAELGSYLLYRNGRGVKPTAAGIDLLDAVRTFLASVDSVKGRAPGADAPLGGKVSFGAILHLSDAFSPAVLMRYRGLFPDVQLHVVGGNSGFIQEWLLDGRIDMGLIYEAGRSRDLIAERILTEKMMLLGSRELAARYGIGRADDVRLADITALPLAIPSRHHGLRRTIDQAAQRAGVDLNIAYEVDNIVVTKGLVRLGGCFAILPAGAALDLFDHADTVVAEVSDPGASLIFSLAYARNRPFSPAARELAAMILAEADEYTGHIESLLGNYRKRYSRREAKPSTLDSLVP